MNKPELSTLIKNKAFELGFDACNICKAGAVERLNGKHFEEWLAKEYHAEMEYMARNVDKRLDPTLLVEGAKSVVMLALNYYPHEFQEEENPQFAYYAYGQDYHDVIREKLKSLYEYCQSIDSQMEGRYFCDTAPLLERYWAAKSGMGWIGKNSLLIIPHKGTYFFLAALVLNTEMEYEDLDKLKMPSCVNCTKCIDACPTNAIVSPKVVNSQKCLSYQTIENKGEIALDIVSHMNNRVYGCDICQQVCPWNRFAKPHATPEFQPKEEFLSLTALLLENMEAESYQQIFKGSAIKRAKLSGLKRNIEAVRKSKE